MNMFGNLYLNNLLFLIGICYTLSEKVTGSNVRDSESQQLFDDYFQWRMKDSPQFATKTGIHDYDDLLTDYTEEAYEARYRKCQEFLRRAKSLEPTVTDKAEKYNLKILKYELQTYIKYFPLKSYYLQMSSFEGSAVDMNRLFEYMLKKSYDDYFLMVQRMQKIPEQFDHIIELMKAGVRNNITFHRISLKSINTSLEKYIVDDVTQSPLYKFFEKDFPENITQYLITVLQGMAKETINTMVVPAYRRLLNYVLNDYLPRENIAITSINNGVEFYKALIEYHTGTNYSPQEIQNIGFDEVARIERNMGKIIKELGHENMSNKEFSKLQRDDPNYFYNTSTEVMAKINEIIHDLVPPKLPQLFNKIPKTELIVKLTPSPGGSFAYYISGSLDGERSGAYYINAHNPKLKSKYGLLTLSLHEGSPGHHFQGSYANENENFPLFRRYSDHSNYGIFPSAFPVYAYYGEGWALYAENLGFDMELYGDPLDRYGHYTAEIFRACRLVVDTGMHALGWSREKAIEYMFSRLDSPRERIENEIDRYITWPGQALAYKLGQIKISGLRAKAEKSLGEKFNIKDFHTVVLDARGPMELVEAEVDNWIQDTLSGKGKSSAHGYALSLTGHLVIILALILNGACMDHFLMMSFLIQ